MVNAGSPSTAGWRRFTAALRQLLRRPAAALGVGISVLFLLVAVFGPLIAPYGANQQILQDAGQPPSAAHWFGTDNLGRDVFSRVVLGARGVLTLAGLGTLLAVVLGTVIGLVSGYYGGLLDEAIMRFFDSLLSLPALLLALLLLGSLGPSRNSVLGVIIVVYPPYYESGQHRHSRCHRWDEIEAGKVSARQPAPDGAPAARAGGEEPNLVLEDLRVHFSEGRSLKDLIRQRSVAPVRAVDGVDLSIPRGRTLGLVGESGSGKTTLARAVVGLVERTGGEVSLREIPLSPSLKGRGEDVLCCLQIVFQSPDEALNPYLSVGEALRRPMMRLLGRSRAEAEERVARLLEGVHLPPEYARRLPGQLSGGQKQRVAIARAFAPDPDMFIADEPVTSLDVSVQASILNLLNELQAEHGNSTLFISHDLAVVGYLADHIAVMYLGRLMETGPVGAVFRPPYHPYTEVLLSSVPIIGAEKQEKGIQLEGEIPSPAQEISGCPFHTRCPRFLGDICVQQVPPWREEEASGKRIFCHIPLDDLHADQEPPAPMRHAEE